MRNPLDFSKDAFQLINTALGVKQDAEIEEIEVTDEQLQSMEPKPSQSNTPIETPQDTIKETGETEGEKEVIDLQTEENTEL